MAFDGPPRFFALACKLHTWTGKAPDAAAALGRLAGKRKGRGIAYEINLTLVIFISCLEFQ